METPTTKAGGETTTQTQSADINLVDKLTADESGAYTVTKNNGALEIAVTKAAGQEWAHCYCAVTESLANIKSLRFTISGTCKVIVKVESSAGGKEVTLQLGSTAVGYEWDLTGADEKAILAGENVKVLIFALPNMAAGSGSFTVSNFVLSEEEAMYNPITSGYTNINLEANNYDGVSETFDINNYWVENDGGTFSYEKQADGSLKLNFTTASWQFARCSLAGSFGKFPYMTIKLQGAQGITVLFKAEGSTAPAKELFINLTGAEQIVTFDLSDYTSDQREASNYLMFATASEWGAQASGEVLFKAIYFTSQYEGEKTYTAKKYDGMAHTFDVNSDWHGNDKGVFEVTNETSPWEVSYTKAQGQEWSALVSLVEGKFGNFKTLKFGIEVAEGTKYMVKVQGDGVAKELELTGTGAYAMNTIDLSTLTVDQRNAINQVLIFIAMDKNEANSGTFKIHHIGFEDYDPPIAVNEYDGMSNSFNINANWFSGDAGVFTVNNETSPWEISYTKAADQGWSALKSQFSGKVGNFSRVTFGLELPEGMKFIGKVEGNGNAKEVSGVGTGVCAAFTIDLSELSVAERDGLNTFLLFVDYENAEANTGSLKMHWCGFEGFLYRGVGAIVMGEGSQSPDLNPAERVWFSNTPGEYTFAREDGQPLVVSYDKAAGGEWGCIIEHIIGGKIGNFNKLNMGLNIPLGKNLLVKFEGDTVSPKEFTAEGKGEYFTYEFDLSTVDKDVRNGWSRLVIFAEPNVAPTTGSFEIHWASFAEYNVVEDTNKYDGTAETFAVTNYWFGLDEGAYSVQYNETVATVTFNKSAEQTYMCLVTKVSGDFSQLNKLNYNFTMGDATSIMIKLEGTGAAKEVTIDSTSASGVIDLSEYADLSKVARVVLMVNPGSNEAAQGSFTINSLVFGK